MESLNCSSGRLPDLGIQTLEISNNFRISFLPVLSLIFFTRDGIKDKRIYLISSDNVLAINK